MSHIVRLHSWLSGAPASPHLAPAAAHFAIGSGTKLAIDDAIELTNQFNKFGHDKARIPEVLAAYEEVRRVDVARCASCSPARSLASRRVISTMSN